MKRNFSQLVNREETSKICRICGEALDSISWIYGCIASCEACRKFFYRCSKIDTEKYTCVYKENCVINVETRAKCQYCRLKKCKQEGMNFELIKRTDEETMTKLSPCAVCNINSKLAIRYGVMVCEACKVIKFYF
jgi:hypothetical protein